MKLKIFGFGLALLLMTACGGDKKESDMIDSTATSETYVPPVGNPNGQQAPSNDPNVASQDVQQQQPNTPTREITDAEIKKLSKITRLVYF